MKGKNAQIQSAYLIATFGHIIDAGFTAAPNLLLEHGVKMGLSDKAILFIIQVQRAKYQSKTGVITDADLCMESSEKTLYRIRKELAEIKDEAGNPLIIIKALYEKDEKGKISGVGSSYDFSRLFDEIAAKYAPTGQNDTSETPTGLFVRADSVSLSPTGQNVRANADKMTDTLLELENKNYKIPQSGEIIFSDDTWTYYADGTAMLSDGSTKAISSMLNVPMEVMAWQDKQSIQQRKKGVKILHK